jgi:hypothetical protein
VPPTPPIERPSDAELGIFRRDPLFARVRAAPLAAGALTRRQDPERGYSAREVAAMREWSLAKLLARFVEDWSFSVRAPQDIASSTTPAAASAAGVVELDMPKLTRPQLRGKRLGDLPASPFNGRPFNEQDFKEWLYVSRVREGKLIDELPRLLNLPLSPPLVPFFCCSHAAAPR